MGLGQPHQVEKLPKVQHFILHYLIRLYLINKTRCLLLEFHIHIWQVDRGAQLCITAATIYEHDWKDLIDTFTKSQMLWKETLINSLWPCDAMWRHRSGSTLAHVIACCLTAPSHYLNQCWLIISQVLWHSSKGSFPRNTSAINHYNQLEITYRETSNIRAP